MTFGSLFTGIGGLDLGLERAGMECRWQVEIDEYATRVLERHWPDVPRWRDINDFIADAQVEPKRKPPDETDAISDGWQTWQKPRTRMSVDLIAGGFPCQPVSVAGNQKGDRDERWLWPEFRRVVELLRPRMVVVENVPGLLSADSGRLFGTVVGDLAALGFDCEWNCLPAGAFDLPHLRWRVFIVAYRQGIGWNKGRSESEREQGGPDSAQCGAIAANATSERKRPGKGSRCDDGRSVIMGGTETRSDATDSGCTNAPNSDQPRPQIGLRERGDACTEQSAIERTDWRTVKPTIRRGDDGVPNRIHRLRCLGNAVVPQVAEWIGRQIMRNAG